MKNIQEIINEMDINALKNLSFSYSDEISIIDTQIDNENLNYWLWKYYTGNITENEHLSIKEKIKDNIVYTVYDIIFQIKNSENVQISTYYNSTAYQDNYNFINEVADLWLMRPERFQYEEEFKKLIFLIYLETQEEKFRQIALDFYNKNEAVANGYILGYDSDKYKNMFLIHNKDECDYNKHYGVQVCENETTDSDIDSIYKSTIDIENRNKDNTDFINKLFFNKK